MTWELLHGDARHVSDVLEPASVDLIVTSPPYFALRSYRDECDDCDGTGEAPPDAIPSRIDVRRTTGGPSQLSSGGSQRTGSDFGSDGDGNCRACSGTGRSHFDGQLGSEATPGEFIDALIECTEDWLKVLKPGGSIFVNLGDKRAGSGGHNNNGLGKSTLNCLKPGYTPPYHEKQAGTKATRRNAPDRYNQASDGIPTKSLMLLPHRYAIACTDRLGLIVRADMVWHKPNGLPESVTDRVRQNHEYWFHLTREPRYFAAIDEIREAQDSLGKGRPWSVDVDGTVPTWGIAGTQSLSGQRTTDQMNALNPLGKLPGSVWTVPSEPLTVPAELGVDHFAAFPSELPRRLILGWSPSGWCEACGEARRPVVEHTEEWAAYKAANGLGDYMAERRDVQATGARRSQISVPIPAGPKHTILGYRCACPDTIAPTRPAVILDPFAGTGTTVAVAHHLGRHGIGIDLSRDYLRLAEWRCTSDTRLRDKVLDRSDLPAAPKIDGQLSLLGDE